MRVILAPMQGVLDPFVRQLLTEVNEYDLCITEFVRVVDQLLPEKVFYRLCPELKNQGFTPSKTPVRVQLLGQHPNCLAENAHRAIELGSHGIDLNCGCPSKTVNGSNGGAALLKQNCKKMPWVDIQKILQKYAEMENFHDSGFYHVARIKQWLRYLNKEYPEADIVFERIKTSKTAEDLRERLYQS